MSTEYANTNDPRIEAALSELQGLIGEQYPEARFEIFSGEDPEGMYLRVIVDVEDTDSVVDVFIDRLLEMQIDEELPVYVIPVRPLERAIDSRHPKLPMWIALMGTSQL